MELALASFLALLAGIIVVGHWIEFTHGHSGTDGTVSEYVGGLSFNVLARDRSDGSATRLVRRRRRLTFSLYVYDEAAPR